MIARVAEGSVRDALSLLDQAIATAEGPIDGGAGPVRCWASATALQLLDLFDTVMRGDAEGALERFGRALRARRRPGRPWRRTCSRSATGCRG